MRRAISSEYCEPKSRIAIIERLILLSVVLSELLLTEFMLGELIPEERASSRFSKVFDDVGGEETTVDTSILMR